MSKRDRYTPEQVSDALQQTKGLVSLAARRLGCTPRTVRNYAARYAEVRITLHEERDHLLDLAELALFNALVRGERWAIIYTLTTLGKERGYTTRGKATGTNGQPLTAPIIYIPQEDPLPSTTALLPSTADDDEDDDAA
jgi:hypothetical protein